jgi:hypothetical protein
VVIPEKSAVANLATSSRSEIASESRRTESISFVYELPIQRGVSPMTNYESASLPQHDPTEDGIPGINDETVDPTIVDPPTDDPAVDDPVIDDPNDNQNQKRRAQQKENNPFDELEKHGDGVQGNAPKGAEEYQGSPSVQRRSVETDDGDEERSDSAA